MQYKGLLTILLACWGFSSLFASNENDSISLSTRERSHVFLQFGAGGHFFSVRDLGTSPLTYNGVLPGGEVGVYIHGKNFISDIDYGLAYGYLKNRNNLTDLSTKSNTYNNVLNALFAWNLKPSGKSKTRLFAGANLNVIGNFRNNEKFNNASYNYEVFASIGPQFIIEREFSLKRHQLNLSIFRYPFCNRTWRFSVSAYVPVFTAAIRPSYPLIEDYLGNSSRINLNLKGTQWTSLNTYTNFETKLQLFYYLHNGNKFRFSYQLYYYDYHPGENRVRGVDGAFMFSFLFSLTNHN